MLAQRNVNLLDILKKHGKQFDAGNDMRTAFILPGKGFRLYWIAGGEKRRCKRPVIYGYRGFRGTSG